MKNTGRIELPRGTTANERAKRDAEPAVLAALSLTRETFPLENLKPRDYCEMCGDRDRGSRHRAKLEPSFNPSEEPKTLCQQCRIGSAELLHERSAKAREFVALVSRMTLEEEYEDGQAPPSEDWISTLNELIESARKIFKPRTMDDDVRDDLRRQARKQTFHGRRLDV